MKITLEVRDFAVKQNAGLETFVAAEEADAGMAEMSRVYNEGGREFYVGRVGEGKIDHGLTNAIKVSAKLQPTWGCP